MPPLTCCRYVRALAMASPGNISYTRGSSSKNGAITSAMTYDRRGEAARDKNQHMYMRRLRLCRESGGDGMWRIKVLRAVNCQTATLPSVSRCDDFARNNNVIVCKKCRGKRYSCMHTMVYRHYTHAPRRIDFQAMACTYTWT